MKLEETRRLYRMLLNCCNWPNTIMFSGRCCSLCMNYVPTSKRKGHMLAHWEAAKEQVLAMNVLLSMRGVRARNISDPYNDLLFEVFGCKTGTGEQSMTGFWRNHPPQETIGA